METKFNSQICTTREQSERLLKLGLKSETADMCWTKMAAKRGTFYIPELAPINMVSWRHTPAWSLHRLLNLIPTELEVDIIPLYGRNYKQWVCFNMNYDYNIIYFDSNQEEFKGFYESNVYDKAISCIEWLIGEGYFPKDCLV